MLRPSAHSRRLVPTRRGLVALAVLAVGVIVLGDLAIRLAPAGTHVAAWWPAAGLAVAVGVRFGRRGLPWAAVVTYGASVVANQLGGRPLDTTLLFSLANTLEVLVTASLVLRWVGRRPMLTVRDLSGVVAATLLGAGAAGAVAAVAVGMHTDGSWWVTARAVSTSHFSAVLLFLPFALERERRRPRARRLEVVLTGSGLALLTVALFAPHQSLPVVFMLFPLLVVTAFRQTLRTCALQLVVVNTVATVATSLGWGPIHAAVSVSGIPLETAGAVLQALIASSAATVYVLRVSVETRLQALADADRARRHLGAVIDAAPSTAIIQTDLDGVIRVFNAGAVNLLGYPAEDVVGKHTPELFVAREELRQRAEDVGVTRGFEAMVHTVRTGLLESDRRDWTYVTAAGVRRRVSQVVSRVDDADGTPMGFLAIAEDVETQRRVEQLLVQSLEQERALAERLRAADALKSDFVTSVSHELRTPMTSVLGYSELLVDDFGDVLGPGGRPIVERIQANGRRLLALVDDLLTLSRLESGSLTLKHEPFEVAWVARSAVAVLQPLARASDIGLALHLPEESTTVQGDPQEMERVLINLLSNAVKFTPAHGRIDLTVRRRDLWSLEVEVRDTGVGIPAADLDKVFTRFHRASNVVESQAQGTGLGLAIVKAIVAKHGGTLSVESELSRGSTFVLALPTTVAPELPADAPAPMDTSEMRDVVRRVAQQMASGTRARPSALTGLEQPDQPQQHEQPQQATGS